MIRPLILAVPVGTSLTAATEPLPNRPVPVPDLARYAGTWRDFRSRRRTRLSGGSPDHARAAGLTPD